MVPDTISEQNIVIGTPKSKTEFFYYWKTYNPKKTMSVYFLLLVNTSIIISTVLNLYVIVIKNNV